MDTSLIRTTSMQAMERGLRFARDHLLLGEEAIEFEGWSHDDLPTGERERLLNAVRNARWTDQELKRHLGQPPIPADRRTHLLMKGLLRERFPHCSVVGEEAADVEWDAAQQAPQGSLLFQIDSIDGSLPYDTLGFGYGTNILAYERHADKDELLLAAVANSSGYVAVFEAPRTVIVGEFTSQKSVIQPLTSDFRGDSIAILGARPKHRGLALPLLEDENLTVFTTAGAPAALGLIIGRLGALCAPEAQTTHDAAYLPILAYLGVPIFIDGTKSLGLSDVLQYFSQVARSQEDRRAHPVPRFVAARNPAFGIALANRLFT